MKIVSTAWITGSLAEFEAACCLNTHAELGLASSDSHFDVLILEGFEKLTEHYVRHLAERHIVLVDVGPLAQTHSEKYKNLFGIFDKNQGSVYEFYCFIRWMVMEEYMSGEPFVHIDLDLFFQKPLKVISDEFSHHTGTFGSPCLTAVSDRDWLTTYRRALDEMVVDRNMLQGALNYRGNEFRADISSDQDLVIALEASGRLPRGGLADLHASYQVFINPLWPYQHKPVQPMAYAMVDGVDTIGGKPVLFWHLQNNFADYLSRYATIMNYKQTWMNSLLPVKLNFPFIQLAPSAENFAFLALREMAWHRIRATVAASGDVHELGSEKFFSRTWISTWFVQQKFGREIFSSQCWWEDGVFVKAEGGS